MAKKIVIGLGTGRCGTMSLAKILNSSPSAIVSHEGRMSKVEVAKARYIGPPNLSVMPWNASRSILKNNIDLIIKRKAIFSGDVGFYYLPYVNLILSSHPSTKFVIMKRDREQTVHSYMQLTEGRNHWQNFNKNSSWNRDKKWDPCYPKFDVKSKENAIRRYWDEYYKTSYKLQQKYPKNVCIFETNSLNTDHGLHFLAKFTNIDGINYSIKRIHNRGGIKNPLYKERG